MQSDHLNFERFEELFDEENGDFSNEPLFETGWMQSESICLHSNQAGVFVSSIDVMQFVDGWMKTINLFVSYVIKSEESTVKMTLNAGELQVDASTIFGTESEIIAGKSEIYKDLLAVTSTSTEVEMTVKFEKPPKQSFPEFLKKKLRFIQLAEDAAVNVTIDVTADQSRLNNTEKMEIDYDAPKMKLRDSFFFYSDDNYFKGMFIRFKVSNALNISMKIYLRSNHQIVTFVKAIHQQYAERCAVKVAKNNEIKN